MLTIPSVALNSAQPGNWPRVIINYGPPTAKRKAVQVLKGAKT